MVREARERAAQEADEAQRRKERLKREAHEAAERLRAMRAATEQRYQQEQRLGLKRDVRPNRKVRRNRNEEQPKLSGRSTRDPALQDRHATPIVPRRTRPRRLQDMCRHDRYWQQVSGQLVCSRCHARQRRFAFQCPLCKRLACASCQRALKT